MTQSNGAFNNAELTEFVRVHNAAIAHHQQWLTDHETAIAKHDAAVAKHDLEIEQIRALQQTNEQQLAILTAGLLDLRAMVADYLQGRS